jgi:hypothetical protein
LSTHSLIYDPFHYENRDNPDSNSDLKFSIPFKMNTNAKTSANQVVVIIAPKNDPVVSGGPAIFDVPRNVQTVEPHRTYIRFGLGDIGMINVNASHNSMNYHDVDSQTSINNYNAGASSSRQPTEQVPTGAFCYDRRGQKSPTRLTTYNHDSRAERSHDNLARHGQEYTGPPDQHEETFDIGLPIERNLIDPATQERRYFAALQMDETLQQNQSAAENPQSYNQDRHWVGLSTASSGSSYISSSNDGSFVTGGLSATTKSTSIDDDRSYESRISYISKDEDCESKFSRWNDIHEGIIRNYPLMTPAIQASQSEGIQSVPSRQEPTLIPNAETLDVALEEIKTEIKEYLDNLLDRILAPAASLVEPQPEFYSPAAEETVSNYQAERDGRFADADDCEDEDDFPPAGPVPSCREYTVGRAPATTTGISNTQRNAAQKRNTSVHFENCYQPVYNGEKQNVGAATHGVSGW